MDDQGACFNRKTRRRAPQLLTPCAVSLWAPSACQTCLGLCFHYERDLAVRAFNLAPSNPHHPRSRLDYETAQHWAWRKLITFALLLVSQFVGHRLCAHRRNAELCLDIDLVSVGDRMDVLIIVLQMGCWELGD